MPRADRPGARPGGPSPRDRRPRTRRGRAPWGSLSRDQIVEAARAAMLRDGFEEVTIRSLAAELGVAPMSLYRHVRDKDDLLDEVTDGLLADVWRPKCEEADWRGWVSEAADRLRELLVSQPAALHVYLSHPVVSPSANQRRATALDVLGRGGFSERSARHAYAAVQTYTLGFAALEASRDRWVPPEGPPDELAAELAGFTTPQQFDEGLQYLLDGIGQRRPNR